ncbi:MAG: hypothetical protein ACQEUT_18250 [Bacillota bacterium]
MEQTTDVRIGKFLIKNVPLPRTDRVNYRLGSIISFMEINEITTYDYTEKNPQSN